MQTLMKEHTTKKQHLRKFYSLTVYIQFHGLTGDESLELEKDATLLLVEQASSGHILLHQ